MSNQSLGRPGGIPPPLAGRIAAAACLIAAFVVGSCADPGTTPHTPTVPSTQTVKPQTSGVTTSVLPDRSTNEDPGESRMSESRAEAVLAHEFASRMEERFGAGWRTSVRKLLDMDFVAIGMSPAEQRGIRDFYRVVTDVSLAASGAPRVEDHEAVVSFRQRLREAGNDRGSQPVALNGVALDVMTPIVQKNSDDPDAGPEGDAGDGDDCESYQACAHRARNECQQYATAEALIISEAAVQACVWVGVIGGTVTSNPLVGVGSGLVCRLLTSSYLNYIKRLLEEECTTMKCGYYPYCI